MAFSDAAMVAGAIVIDSVITHMQLHSDTQGTDGSTNAVGTRVPVAGSLDFDGSITWTTVAFTGLPADQPVAEVSYWSAPVDGNYYGGTVLTGDAGADSGGAYTITSLTETAAAD